MAITPEAKHWCFTINNYNDSECIDDLPPLVNYVIYGKEVCPKTLTPHLQGYIAFSKKRRLTQVKKLFPRAHWEVARNLSCAPEYCKKDGNYVELGTLPTPCIKGTNGKRNELRECMATIKSGVIDFTSLAESHPNVMARYPVFVNKYIRAHLPKPRSVVHPLRVWQHKLVEQFTTTEPDLRLIYFIVDLEGGIGKTHVAKVLRRDHGALVIGAGKKADLSFIFANTLPPPRIVVVDVPKCKMETLHIDFLEELKNGLMTSTKFDSCMIEFDPPHVVVMCNEPPDESKMTQLRADITYPSGPDLDIWVEPTP